MVPAVTGWNAPIGGCADTASINLAFDDGSIGTVVYAANQVAINGWSLSFMPGFGFAVAATTLVGQGLGAGHPDLAVLVELLNAGNDGGLGLAETHDLDLVLRAQARVDCIGRKAELRADPVRHCLPVAGHHRHFNTCIAAGCYRLFRFGPQGIDHADQSEECQAV